METETSTPPRTAPVDDPGGAPYRPLSFFKIDCGLSRSQVWNAVMADKIRKGGTRSQRTFSVPDARSVFGAHRVPPIGMINETGADGMQTHTAPADKRPGHDRVKLAESAVWWIAQWRDQHGRTRQRRMGEKSLMPWHVAAAKAIVFSCELRQQRTSEPPPAEVRLSHNKNYWLAVVGRGSAKFSLTLCRQEKFTREQAMEACAQGEKELARLTPASMGPDGIRWTLALWIDRYIACRSELTEATRNIDKFCGRYLRAYFGDDKPLTELTRADAAAWRAALAAGTLHAQVNEIHTGPPSSPTIAKHVRTAKAMFNEAVNQGLIDTSPFAKLKAGNGVVKKAWSYIDVPTTQRILDACPNAQWRALFALCRFAALRLKEALILQWQDVDFATNRMVIHARCEKETTKVRTRIAPIEAAQGPTGLTAILREALEAAPDGQVLVCGDVAKWRPQGKAIAIVQRAAVPTYSKVFHTLRKNAMTDWAATLPQFVVCEFAGNSQQVARDFYLKAPEIYFAAPPAAAPPPQLTQVRR